jgi:uncharacterized membrane protein
MAMLTAWKFNTPQSAGEALARLKKLRDGMLLNLHDAAVVSWEPGEVYDRIAAEFRGLTLPPARQGAGAHERY